MKTHLLYRGRDFDWEQAMPSNTDVLIQDLELETVFKAMAGNDEYLLEVAKRVMLAGVGDDIATIQYRQAVLKDCQQNSAAIAKMYDLAVEAIERKRKQWFGVLSKSPGGILSGAIDLLQVLMEILGRLRLIGRENSRKFQSEGFVAFFKMLEAELPDDYFDRVKAYLKELKFPEGVLVSAELGENVEAVHHTLRRSTRAKPKFFQRVFADGGKPEYTFKINDKDDAGAKSISALRDRGINVVANAVSQSAEHIMSFLGMLRGELGFYIGGANLYLGLNQQGQPLCFPTPAPVGSGRHTSTDLRDVSLALTVGQQITGNDLQAEGKSLFMVTGANQGGKSTFLRSIGLAQVMMECGLFVTAEAFSASLSRGIFTHFTREEDVTMKSGKFDEELRRMSTIVDALAQDSLVLFNESFAATNEREGSEIARQIVKALLEARVKVFFVTHLYELSHGFFKDGLASSLFLRAERQTGGKRTFKVLPGEPLQTSFGADLYHEIFGASELRRQGRTETRDRRRIRATRKGCWIRSLAAVLEQHVLDETRQMFGHFSVPANHDDQLPNESLPHGQSLERAFSSIESERPDGHEAEAHAQRDEIDDEVETVELHHRLDGQPLPFHPGPHLPSRVGRVLE